jgi:cell division protein FtsA
MKGKGGNGQRLNGTAANGEAMRSRPASLRPRGSLIAGIDVGTTKICCFIGRVEADGPRVVGIGHQLSRGLRGGSIVDLEAATESIGNAIHAAEEMAGLTIERVIVNKGAFSASRIVRTEIDFPAREITDANMRQVLERDYLMRNAADRQVIHSIPVGFSVDDSRGIRDPRGMVGQRLGVDMHVATTDVAAARNLTLLVERCHIGVEAMVAAPYVSGLSVLAEDEADLGAALIDMGAGTTTMAVFSGGRLVHGDGFAVGGQHVTMDIARGLNTSMSVAERIKAYYGSVLSGGSDERDMITIPSVDDADRGAPQFVSRAQLMGIIRPRIEEILEMVRDRLKASSFAAEPRGRVVLTGGASQLNGLVELASQILGRPVRIGRPLGIARLPEEAKGPAFAAATGLLVYPQAAHLEHFEGSGRRTGRMTTEGYIARVGRWLRESF